MGSKQKKFPILGHRIRLIDVKPEPQVSKTNIETISNNQTAPESICIAFFTIEFVARFVSCPAKCEFMKQIGNLIDILARDISSSYLKLIM